LGDEGAASVAEALIKSKVLRTLLLRNNKISDEAAKVFAEAI
jgi:hypothetical protein